MEIDIGKYPTLRDDQRIEARQRARGNLLLKLGGEPHYEDFEKQHWSRFGIGWERATLLFLIVVFLSALWVSSGHIYRVFDDSLAMVILAESTILALSLVPTVWSTPRVVTTGMYVGVMGAAFIAAVGNIDAEIIYTSSPLNWVTRWWSTLATAPKQWTAATVPPMITVLVGQGLKYYALSRSESRREAKTRYDLAIVAWDELVKNIELHAGWRNTYAWALWDVWRKGKRQEMIANITHEVRSAIIIREIEADQILPDADSQLTDNANQHKAKRQAETVTPDIDADIAQLTGKDRVKAYLDRYPAAGSLEIDELADLLAVSGRTVYRGKELVSKNGYHHV